ncbi:unnamed protein product [Chrysodeixis includens]|uniref:C3H1-type domain-containing protein n=1 Tax=Chrysodeixis includens TaxID=689277 RepID=A0A9P0BUH4_CHRIL|nr:unnamed protein product [Chrysodeixis includens]
MYAIDNSQKYVESSLGWAVERGEDSSYDSECEDESAHRAASRTPSDTLAAEFAEYVTLTPTPPNQAKIEFAVKLGYSERLARTALQRLGPDPPCNELLAELIKLAAKQPPRALSPAPPAEPEPPPERGALRHVVIDGSNVAMSHGNKEVFSCRGIEICVEWFRARGHREITAFVPKWRKEAPRPNTPIAERDALERLERERVLVYTPSRLLGGKRLVCYDDRYILRLAAETDGIVVSNDNYRDLASENPDFRKVVEERLLMYSFVNDRFMPPDDPLGRSGPTLDAFLRAPATRVEPPPACPYGRKCTYGNKCKFHHPERAGRPHKSVAEKLSERAAKTLRARDLHTVSLPPGGRPADIKRQLARAQSAAPRLADPTLATHFDRAQVAGPSQPPPPDVNTHRKLARQLTLNPSCDPRLQAHSLAARVASAGRQLGGRGARGRGCGGGAAGAARGSLRVRGRAAALGRAAPHALPPGRHLPRGAGGGGHGGLPGRDGRADHVRHYPGALPPQRGAAAARAALTARTARTHYSRFAI